MYVKQALTAQKFELGSGIALHRTHGERRRSGKIIFILIPTNVFNLIKIVQLGSEKLACEHPKIEVNYRPNRPADGPCAGITLERRRQALALRVICRMALRGSAALEPIFMKN